MRRKIFRGSQSIFLHRVADDAIEFEQAFAFAEQDQRPLARTSARDGAPSKVLMERNVTSKGRTETRLPTCFAA